MILFLAPTAFREGSARRSFPVRFGTEAGTAELRQRANGYMRQTRRLLGARYHEEFYRAAVETRLSSLPAAAEPVVPAERACFDFLTDSDPCAAEVFAFLDEMDGEPLSLPADIPCFAGNPIDAYVARLVLSPPTPAVFRTSARGSCAIPLSFYAGLILSLITLLATVFSPAPPIGGVAGIGSAALQEFFVSLAGFFFMRPVFLRRSAMPGFPRRRPIRSRVPEERQSVCLLR